MNFIIILIIIIVTITTIIIIIIIIYTSPLTSHGGDRSTLTMPLPCAASSRARQWLQTKHLSPMLLLLRPQADGVSSRPPKPRRLYGCEWVG